LNGKQVAARTLIQASVLAFVVLAVLLVLWGAEVFLVAFGGILFAILFQRGANWLHDRSGLGYRPALAVALVVPLALLGLGIWWVAPSIADQTDELVDRIPQAATQLEARAREIGWVDRMLEQQDRVRKALPDGSQAASLAARFFSTTFGGLGNLVFALALGLFLAIDPPLYLHGLLRLFPLDKRERAAEVLRETGSTLAAWLLAKMIAMLVIGVLTTAGLWLIGIDLALVLGLIAAILSFIPNFGPVVAFVPAALIALINGLQPLLWVSLLYAAVQTVESYVLTPVLQQRMVELPPALTIGSQVLLGVLAGVVGVIMATPLTAAAMVMVRMWYVEDTLGDRQPSSP
jgi:predicted PurR-regulated permease PerM